MKMKWSAVVAVLAVVLVVGCASAPKGPSDEELIDQVLTTWTDAILEKDIDKGMSVTSENFSNAEASDKSAWRSYLEWISGAGYLDGAEVDDSNSETVIDGDKATVGPLVLTTAAGVFNLELNLDKEEGGWMVVSSVTR
jgi:hypothetical protein